MASPRLALASLAAALTLVLPASASAAQVPCADLGLVRAGACAGTPAVLRCADADTLPTIWNLVQIRRSTLCLLNGERAARGLRPLREHAALQAAAVRYARTMVAQRFFSHTGADGSSMTSRIRRTTYLRGAGAWALGENLAWGSGERATPAQTVRGWMDSPGHRRNVLDRSFREIGIGISPGAPVPAIRATTATTYVTEFGRRS